MAVANGRPVALVLGVANSRSIAWSSALCLMNRGYDVLVTYQNERFKPTVEKLIDNHKQSLRYDTHSGNDDPSLTCFPCDVSSEESIKKLFNEKVPTFLQQRQQNSSSSSTHLDAIVHSIAHAPPDAMKNGSLLSTSLPSFSTAHAISSYSLLSVARLALPLLTSPDDKYYPSLTALTYLGSTRAVPNYNVMGPAKASLEAVVRGLALELGPEYGIRVNAVSSGPIKTLSARGIRGFTDMTTECELKSPLRRNVTADEVGEMVSFLAGKEARGITGQVFFVDAGYSIVGGTPS
mmetsp:Transcript_28828/g.35072  ORF Transcript_28828/g.35072 Transcript_28828/m.35072 type:complete len:293 (+) Transcript_28828:50-928(+)